MIKNPIVSVVVPCYNQAQYLDEALQSVFNQTFVDWECIIVNDGSPDDTEVVAAKWLEKDERFKYIYQENSGLSAARNAGISVAEGEFILPLDSDDYFKNTFIEKALKALFENSEVGVVSCFVKGFTSAKETVFRYEPKGGAVEDFIYGNNACGNSLFRKEVWRHAGGYDINMKNGYEDWEFWIAVTRRGWKVQIIPEYLFNYRQKLNSMLNITNRFSEEENYRYVLNKHKDLYIKDFDKTIEFLQKRTKKYKANEIKRLNSKEYRIGNFLLKPIRFLITIFFKNNL